MSGRYSTMDMSQHLAAPTYPKINEYNRMEARKRSEVREVSETRTRWGRGKSDILAKSGRRFLELYYSTQITGG